MYYRIGQVAALAKVSVRLLHHYDQIGLLVPSQRSDAAYRLYTHADLQRLQQILFYRTLEFPLEEILRIMSAPDFNRRAALLQQRELLRQKAAHLGAVLALIEQRLMQPDIDTGDTTMNTQALFEAFPDLDQSLLDEAEVRWGESEAWRQSAARHRCHDKADWDRMKEEMEAINVQMEAVFKAGLPPESPEALAAVEAARLLIQHWHYDCSRDFHVRLTAMTSSDERFVRNIDRTCPGLAAWIHAAAKANLAVQT